MITNHRILVMKFSPPKRASGTMLDPRPTLSLLIVPNGSAHRVLTTYSVSMKNNGYGWKQGRYLSNFEKFPWTSLEP